MAKTAHFPYFPLLPYPGLIPSDPPFVPPYPTHHPTHTHRPKCSFELPLQIHGCYRIFRSRVKENSTKIYPNIIFFLYYLTVYLLTFSLEYSNQVFATNFEYRTCKLHISIHTCKEHCVEFLEPYVKIFHISQKYFFNKQTDRYSIFNHCKLNRKP